MTCTKAQIQVLLEKIREELIHDDDKAILDEWIKRIRIASWSELESEFFSV